jgi:hypothetical protein
MNLAATGIRHNLSKTHTHTHKKKKKKVIRRLIAFLLLHQLGKRWFTVALIEEEIG